MNKWNEIYQKGVEEYEYYDLEEPHEDIEKVIDYFKKGGVNKVLDLGCGIGRNMIPLAKAGFKMTGVDLSVKGVDLAKKKIKENGLSGEFARGDFQKLPFKDRKFDAVVAVQVLQHGREDEIRKAVDEIERVLIPKGAIFITLSGRYSKGKVRYCLVKTAKRVGERTYIPMKGNEIGVPHFIYNKEWIRRHYQNFLINQFWRDDKDYYCFLANKNE